MPAGDSLRERLELAVDAAWRRLTSGARLGRGRGDCYGHIFVAIGRTESSLDPIMNPWDCGPLLPILEEAEGTFSDWRGTATIHGPDAFPSNGRVFDEIPAAIHAP